MQIEVAETIFEKVKSLLPEEQEKVLNFVENLQVKTETEKDNQNAAGESKETGLQNLWREIDEIVARVPEEAWDEVPTDGSINHDYYLYGASKRQK